MNGRRSTRPAATIPVLALVALAACSATPTAGDASPAAASSSAHAPAEYSTTQFAVPLTVSVGSELDGPEPAADTPHLLYWDGSADDTKVRFLDPAVTYAPGTTSPMAPPGDFVGYLHQQEQNGFELSDETTRTVDGHPATLLTATSQDAPGSSYDGSLGCVAADTPLEDLAGCFGVQPEYSLRLAVVDLDGHPLLAWARTSSDDPDAAGFFAEFEQMLDSVHLR